MFFLLMHINVYFICLLHYLFHMFEYDARVSILDEYSKVLSLPKVLGHLRFQEQI